MSKATIFWGVVVILAGVIVILSTVGVISVNLWAVLFPLLLIALGAWILWGVYAPRPAEVKSVQIPLGSAQRATIQLRHGAGKLILGASDSQAYLAVGEFDDGVEVQTRQTGGDVEVTFKSPYRYFPVLWSTGKTPTWKVQLARGIALKLDISSGASDTNLDLSGLMVSELRFQGGASSNQVTLPAAAGLTTANFSSGAASVILTVPEGVAARIRASNGIGSVRVDRSRFPRRSGYYQSEGYESAPNKVDMRIHSGVGSVEVR